MTTSLRRRRSRALWSGHPPYVLGVTGGIASGKTTVMNVLAARGAETIDADRVYHELIEPASPLWTALRSRYGAAIIDADGRIDRAVLGSIVFGNSSELAALDALTHPFIVAEIERRIAASRAGVVAVDAVKLLESGADRSCHQVWLIRAPRSDQRQRLIRDRGFAGDEADRRIDSQPDWTWHASECDVVIENDGDLDHLTAQIDENWRKLPILPI